MAKKNAIKLFEDKLVRSVWDDEKEEWFFSIVDVVEILTDSKDPKQYIKKMRSRDEELNLNWVKMERNARFNQQMHRGFSV